VGSEEPSDSAGICLVAQGARTRERLRLPTRAGGTGSLPPEQKAMPQEIPARCPHCDGDLLRWANPEGSSWGDGFQYVCFNDGCPYYVRGWEWMQGRYNVAASYRFRVDPLTGERGPLPVWSAEALRNNIISKPEEGSSHAL
jgi:hypothetical protein